MDNIWGMLLKRLGLGLVTLLVISVLIFGAVELLPGDPAEAVLGMGATEEDVQAASAKYKAHFPEWRLDSFPGYLGNVMAGRCANVFNLDGMNCVVDAACASSLIAVKVAIDELLRGDCETMIAGATCSDCSLAMYMAFSKTPVFSTKQSLTAYDNASKGMLIGEGSVVYVT